MEEEKKLYPLRFVPIEGEEGESVQIADLGYQDSEVRNGWLAASTISEVMDMYMDRVVGEGVFGYFGRQFPVLIRRRVIKGLTPLTVHPDDTVAEERFDFLGKSKLIYVESAGKDSKIYLGFRRDVSAEEFYLGCQDGSVRDLLNGVGLIAGQHHFIYPGLVYAIEGPATIIEISESSPLDFRLCSWGGSEEQDEFDSELTLEAAFDFIDFGKYRSRTVSEKASESSRRLTDNKEFTVHEIRLTDPVHIFCEKFGSFVTYTCVSGEASLQVPGEAGTETFAVSAGETVLVPVEVPDFFLVPMQKGTVLLETMVEAQDEVDRYINQDADAELADSDDSDIEDIDVAGSPLLN